MVYPHFFPLTKWPDAVEPGKIRPFLCETPKEESQGAPVETGYTAAPRRGREFKMLFYIINRLFGNIGF